MLLGFIAGSDEQRPLVADLTHLGMGVFFYILCLGCIIGSIFLIHFLFTLPMRRAERARLFLELLEGALNRGQSVEEMILSIARSRDRTVGIHFHFLAAHIESGLRFSEALKITPRFLPPQILAMLAAGAKLGDLKKILPACREILRDRPASVRSAMHYLILVGLVFSPMFIFVLFMTNQFVIPKFRDVAAGMGIQLWRESTWVFRNTSTLMALETAVSLLIALAVLFYIGGPHFTRWFKFRRFPLVDWITWHLPWKRKRLLVLSPPCFRFCSMAGCRRPKRSALPVPVPPMKSVGAGWLGWPPRSPPAKNWMPPCADSMTVGNSIGGCPTPPMPGEDF